MKEKAITLEDTTGQLLAELSELTGMSEEDVLLDALRTYRRRSVSFFSDAGADLPYADLETEAALDADAVEYLRDLAESSGLSEKDLLRKGLLSLQLRVSMQRTEGRDAKLSEILATLPALPPDPSVPSWVETHEDFMKYLRQRRSQ